MRISRLTTLAIAGILLNLAGAVALQAQQAPKESPLPSRNGADSNSLRFAKGSAKGTIVLNVTDPIEVGDAISGTVSTDHLVAALIFPNGKRITKETADSAGLQWFESPMEAPFGSADGGHSLIIDFLKPAPAGRYVVEFTAMSLKAEAVARTSFVSKAKLYYAEMRLLPGVQFPAPVELTRSSAVSFELAAEEHGALLDVVVPDRAVKITIAMPDGRTLQTGQQAYGVEWKTFDDIAKVDPPGSWFGIGGFLMPVKGIHHVIGLETLPKGRYEIRAVVDADLRGELRVAFIPLSRLLEMATKENKEDKGPHYAADEVHIEAVGLPPGCFAGDALDMQFSLLGDVGATPVQFTVKLERTEPLPYTVPGEVHYGPPQVENVAVKFARAVDGRYHGTIKPTKPGIVRISLRAAGKKTSGSPFNDEVVFSQLNVAPLVARLTKITAEAVDTNGDHKLDRLDVVGQLDVVVPGEYDMTARVQDSANGGAYATVRAELQKGPQHLVASLDAKELRKLKDGPYEIRDIRIYRSKNVNYGDYVAGETQPVRTAPYKREDWDPGPIFADESVSIRGIHEAPSGRFRFAEVEWGVTTPGGDCYWDGSLGGTSIHGSGKLPAGRRPLSMVFPGSVLAAAGNQEVTFWGMLACHNLEAASSPFVKLKIDPAMYEPAAGQVSIVSQSMLQVSPGRRSGAAFVDVPGKKLGQVEFKLGELPPGIWATLDSRGKPEFAAQSCVWVEVAPGVKPGRYYVVVAASFAGETGSTEIVVDVVPPE